jgi:hypothetical protein
MADEFKTAAFRAKLKKAARHADGALAAGKARMAQTKTPATKITRTTSIVAKSQKSRGAKS